MAPHLMRQVRCASCRQIVELECKGLEGFWGYESYNEYICPHCGKRDTALCSGTIVAVRPGLGPVSQVYPIRLTTSGS